VLVRGVLGEAGDFISRVLFARGSEYVDLSCCFGLGWWSGENIRWRTSSLQERRLADLTLDVHGLLIDLQLRLCDLGLVVFAIALRGCLGSLTHMSALPLPQALKLHNIRFPSLRFTW
jgi:hypothetical protein